MNSDSFFKDKRILVLGVQSSKKQMKLISKNIMSHGGLLAEEMSDATHLVLLKDKTFASYDTLIKSLNVDKLPENLKIVSEDWLNECLTKEILLPEFDFLVTFEEIFDDSNINLQASKKMKLNEINDEKRKEYALMLMVEEDDEVHQAYLQRCQKAIGKDEDLQLCFQMDGTRHFTVAEGYWTDEEVASITFNQPLATVDLPIKLTLSDPLHWDSCFALKIESISWDRVCKLIEKLELPAHIKRPKNQSNFHLSLYRNRGTIEEKKFKHFVQQLKVMHKQPGQVKGVRFEVKLKNAAYTTGRAIL